MPAPRDLEDVTRDILGCRRCPRLVKWREEVARVKVARFRDQDYWARPVPGFGDPLSRVMLLGLAPGAHGSNRTGRMFTGDASGDFLYPALHRAGLASQPQATGRDDGMRLQGVFITAAARCAPPDNKPLPEELRACRPFLAREWEALRGLRVVVCLGRIAHDAALAMLAERGVTVRKKDAAFAHGAEHRLPGAPVLLDSFHVSRQNTNTGKLTPAMFDAILERAKAIAGGSG